MFEKFPSRRPRVPTVSPSSLDQQIRGETDAQGREWASPIKFGVACLMMTSTVAFAAPPTGNTQPTTNYGEEADTSIAAESVGQWSGLMGRSTLFGDIGGLRSALWRYGVSLQATETSEYLSNLRGGLQRGGTYDGLTTVTLGVDTKKAFGWDGGTFNVSALQIHGRNLSEYNLGTLNTASGIEAQDTTRLWELWYQQSFDNKRFDVKVGQQSIDQEFMVSSYAATFVNTMFGWPGLPSYDLPSGGPAYPLSDLGIRFRAQLNASITGLLGVYDADPLGNNPNNLSGTNFNLHTGAMYIGELQYALNQPVDGQMVGDPNQGLPGTYKIGFWYNTAAFNDQRYDNTGLSLANPASTGVPATHRGDYSIYAVADQMIWRPNPDEPRSIGVFARVMAAPGDRNEVSMSANMGIVMKAPFATRENDSVGLGLGYIKIGNYASDLDQDFANLGQYTVRGSETVVEATYQYQATPWWVIQGDLQYTFNAGAGQNPNDPTQALHNTFVAGVRTTITF
jgi:porin